MYKNLSENTIKLKNSLKTLGMWLILGIIFKLLFTTAKIVWRLVGLYIGIIISILYLIGKCA